MQTLDDTVNTLNTKVLFSAVGKKIGNSKNPVKANRVITYTEAVANIGGGMNLDTGTFRAPVAGLYSFSFSATTEPNHHMTFIWLYKNDVYQFRFTDHNTGGKHTYENFSYNWMMNLSRNDEVKLQMSYHNGLWVSDGEYIWFNGQLLKPE